MYVCLLEASQGGAHGGHQPTGKFNDLDLYVQDSNDYRIGIQKMNNVY